ncbi:MAG: VCBS repeat-containing protein [Bacteroidota bacterium]
MIRLKQYVLIAFFSVSESLFGQALFSAKTDFTTGERPISVCIGDLNGDSRPDIVVVNYMSNTVSVFLNTTSPGAMVPSFSTKTDVITGERPMSVSLGDFNGDGKPDLAVADYNSNTVSLILNTTASGDPIPSFSNRIDLGTGERPISVAVGDLNGDGKPDLAVVNYKSSTISVFLNTTVPGSSTPSFAPRKDFTTGDRPVSVSIRDLNGDAKPDLAVVNYRSNTVSIFLNTTVPGIVVPSFLSKIDFITGERPISVAIGDLNGDGKPDLAVANYGSNTVSTFLNATASRSTSISFSRRTEIATGLNPQFICLKDLNGDGRLDISVANYNSATVSVWLNTTAQGDTTFSFSTKKELTTGTAPSSISIGDLNGDGKPDLTLTNYGSNTVSVFLNKTASENLHAK